MLFFNNLTSPIVPATIEDWVIFSLWAVLLTIVSWYICSLVWVTGKDFTNRRGIWKGETLIRLAKIEGAILTAALWTSLIGYCFFTRNYDGWMSFIPYWIGLSIILIITAAMLISLKAQVKASSPFTVG